MTVSLSIVHVADASTPAATASLTALVDAAGVAEARCDVDAVLVAHSPDGALRELLSAIDGADVVTPDRRKGVGVAWQNGWRSTAGELVYLSSTLSYADPHALLHLVEALLADPGLAAAWPGSAAPGSALVRRSALEEVGRRRGGLSTSPLSVYVLDRLHRDLDDLDLRSVVVPQAQVGGVPLVQPPTVLHPDWTNAQVRSFRRDAVTVGPHTYFTGNDARVVTYSPLERIEIGAYCSIADEVRLVNPHEAGADFADTSGPQLRLRMAHRPTTATTLPVGNRFPGLDGFDPFRSHADAESVQRIGSDVWIGYGALVLGPVTIGHGAIIGARAVVTQDVPPYTIVAGSPARALRKRFDDDTIAALLRIAWWDWPEDFLMSNAPWFLRPAEEFAVRFDPGC